MPPYFLRRVQWPPYLYCTVCWFVYKCNTVNPILHTVWLENHALSLKCNTAKYYVGGKSEFLAYFPKMWSWFNENVSQVQKNFTFKAISIWKKLYLMNRNPAMNCFKCQHYESSNCYPTTGSPPPLSIAALPLPTRLKESSIIVKLPDLL